MNSNTDRAQTNEQKRRVIEAIYESWVKCPDQRLGQLLQNAHYHLVGHQDMFFVEDLPLVDMLRRFVKETK